MNPIDPPEIQEVITEGLAAVEGDLGGHNFLNTSTPGPTEDDDTQ